MSEQTQAPKKAPKAKLGPTKKVNINVDTGVDSVVQYDKEGIEMIFSATPEEFLELPSSVYSSLSKVNALGYLMAKAQRDEIIANIPDTDDMDDDAEWLQSLERIDHTKAGSDVLSIHNRVPGMAYYWVAEHKLLKYKALGWRICKDKRIVTSSNRQQNGSSHIVRQNGTADLILMETTEANRERILAARQAARDQFDTFDEGAAAEAMRNAGAQVTRE